MKATMTKPVVGKLYIYTGGILFSKGSTVRVVAVHDRGSNEDYDRIYTADCEHVCGQISPAAREYLKQHKTHWVHATDLEAQP
jgi:hypothetical protein